MTRDELIEKVARAIFETWAIANESGGTWDELLQMQNKDGYITAKELYNLALEEAAAAIGTIYAAMKEPSVAMQNAAIDVDSFKLGDISPLGFRMSPQRLFTQCYQAMLAASPLAPEGGRE